MRKLPALFLTAAAVLATAPAVAETYKLSILPRFFPERLTAMMTPLAAHLSQVTGQKVELVLAKNFEDYEARVKLGEIVIGYENPVVFARVAERHEALATAIDPKTGERFRGILITRPDSGIKGLADLVGKRVLIVGKTSAAGFISQKASLREANIPLARLTLDEAADNRQENVLIGVSIGDADAGFIAEDAFHVADKYIAPGSVVKVAETAWLPNWALSVDRALPADVKEKLRQGLVSLPKDDPVLKAMDITGFKAAQDSDYAVVRQVVGEP